MTNAQRTLREIAAEIVADWKKPYFGAVPYIDALGQLESVNQDRPVFLLAADPPVLQLEDCVEGIPRDGRRVLRDVGAVSADRRVSRRREVYREGIPSLNGEGKYRR